MTPQEFSDQFDVLYNSVTSNQAPGLDDYEKSVFLTKAQEEIVLKYFRIITNKDQEGFDDSEIREIDFSNLIKSHKVTNFKDPVLDNKPNSKSLGISDLKGKVLAIINEFVDVTRNNNSTRLAVLPISYTEYTRLSSKPFKRPNKYQAWRLMLEDKNINNDNYRSFDIIVGPGDEIKSHYMRYLKRPQAIILHNLEEGLSIDGDNKQQGCELDPIMHLDILQRAVEMAKASYMGDLQSQLIIGNTSQTQVGNIPQQSK